MRNPGRTPRGQSHYRHKLTDDDVLAIRVAYATTNVTQARLADQYNVHQTLIGYIARGATWTHVGGPLTRRGKGWQPT